MFFIDDIRRSKVRFAHNLLTDVYKRQGFINKLPHDLVSAFRATLEEVSGADLIIHVIDSSSSYMDTQISVVEDVLCTLGAADKPRINAYNKIDIASGRPSGGVCISALNGDGLAELMHQIEGIINNSRVEVELVVPYSRYEEMCIRDSLLKDAIHLVLLEKSAEGVYTKVASFESVSDLDAYLLVDENGEALILNAGVTSNTYAIGAYLDVEAGNEYQGKHYHAAVSYTHLDVYKRQALDFKSGSDGMRVRAG